MIRLRPDAFRLEVTELMRFFRKYPVNRVTANEEWRCPGNYSKLAKYSTRSLTSDESMS